MADNARKTIHLADVDKIDLKLSISVTTNGGGYTIRDESKDQICLREHPTDVPTAVQLLKDEFQKFVAEFKEKFNYGRI